MIRVSSDPSNGGGLTRVSLRGTNHLGVHVLVRLVMVYVFWLNGGVVDTRGVCCGCLFVLAGAVIVWYGFLGCGVVGA